MVADIGENISVVCLLSPYIVVPRRLKPRDCG